ncbi:MAG: DUF1223 domain-containing protein [Burkholderiales bacterium PBB5]|nr:MAG: DUF1223 domain-containing protein [Burkholderiales bacterium PBB5]
MQTPSPQWAGAHPLPSPDRPGARPAGGVSLGLGTVLRRLWLAVLCGGATSWAVAADVCSAQSGPQQRLLVELYTSEGCSSCPPADRWLSSLRGQPQVLAVAFHVDYWDQLGWPDRFAQPAFTARQQALQRSSGARFVYTPQVLVNGRDWRQWPQLPAAGVPAQVQLLAERTGAAGVQLTVSPGAGAPARLGLWWALLEDGHQSAVKAGENRGDTLRHDHVARRWVDEGSWLPAAMPRRWTLAAPSHGEGGRATKLLMVVTDAASGAPLQALQLGC